MLVPSLVKLIQVLKEIGTDYVVITGHSERRDYFHETDETSTKSKPIFC